MEFQSGKRVEMSDVVLFVSPHHADAEVIASMLGTVGLRLDHAATILDARARLPNFAYGAILAEAQLPDGDWKDVLKLTYEVGVFPAVIVTHRLADDRFWAEVLNLGAYDLLAQPFDRGEVCRILRHACSQAPARHANSQCPTLRPNKADL